MSDSILIDWEKSIELADHDAELALDILILTARSLPGDMQEITEAVQNEDEREMRRLLHKLEGGISYVKLPVLETATLALHKAVIDSETNKFDELHNQLQIALTKTVVAVQEKIADLEHS